jgi:hypothetical protein
MSYRRPGVTVTQQFLAAAPAVAAINLPSCVIGPAFQLVNNDMLGTYSGVEQTYSYASQLGGSIIDLEPMPEGEMFPVTKKPISVSVRNVEVEILALVSTGSINGVAFSDATGDIFDAVHAGDFVVVVPALEVEVLSAQTNGQSTNTAGQTDRLTGTTGQFSNVKVGDTVTIAGGTNTNPGVFTVTAKISDQVLKLSGDINDGVGIASDIEYFIEGDRGVGNEGVYKIKTVLDENNITLESPMPESEALMSFFIKRKVSDYVELIRGAEFTPTLNGILIDSGLDVESHGEFYPVLSASVYASYRCLRTDLYSEVRQFVDIASIEAVFGVGQIHPSNPLAFALSIMKQNTASPVHGLGLSSDFLEDEGLAYLRSLDVLAMTEMYALCPLSHLGTVHSMFRNHVVELSQSQNKLERIVIINYKLNKVGLIADESELSTALIGGRSVVSSQFDGSGNITNPTILNDASPDAFLNVQLGDSVVVTGGTGVTIGTYLVLSKQSNNQITLNGNIVSVGAPTDIAYYIVRQDGLGADGKSFYDREATFLSSGAAGGHFLEILSGTYKGRYKIGSIESEKEIVLADPIVGVSSLLTGLSYKVTRDIGKQEQSSIVSGYGSSFASRRVVCTWPDVVKAAVGPVLVNVPGYYSAATIAALTTGLPSQQGFTNLTVSGFLGLENSTKYFTEAQLNNIANGGVLIFAQEGPDQPLLIRHQLTTDRSSIKFQEYSVTKNVDFIAKITRNQYASAIGRYNIVDTTLDYLKTIAQSLIVFFVESTKQPFIGGAARSGELVSLAESETQLDTVDIKFAYQIPIPLNYIDIIIEV